MHNVTLPPRGATFPSTSARDAGLDEASLEDAVEFTRASASTGFILATPAGFVVEAYWRNDAGFSNTHTLDFIDGNRSVEDVASVQKSVVSVLTGIALGKGLLGLDDPVIRYLGPGWTHASPDREALITIRHVLTMTSGLDNNDEYVAPPGTRWAYNLGTCWHSMKRVLAAAAGVGLNELLDMWLGEPLGFEHSRFVERPVTGGIVETGTGFYPGTGRGVEGFVTTARDLARFGLAVLGRGRVGGRDLGIAPGYLAESLTPATTLNPSYGYMWWLNGKSFRLQPPTNERMDGPFAPQAPPDMVSALGNLRRHVHVIPSRGLVSVRLGGDPEQGELGAPELARPLFSRLQFID